jgi:MFS family permease
MSASPASAPTPVTTSSVIRNPDFVRLWIAATISQFGTQISLLALPLVAVTLLGASPFEVALLGTVEFLPFILFSLPAGAWVDRLRRRPILIVGDIGRALVLISIPAAYVLDVLTIWQLYVVGFVAGTLTVLFDVAYQSYLPSLVEREQLVDGNGKLEISRTLAQTAGPALGGGLIGLITAPLAVLVDALSYGLSAVFVFLIRRREPTPDPHVDEHGRTRGSLLSEVRDGLRFVIGDRYLRAIAASTATSNLFTNIALATYIVYAVRDLGLSPAAIGIVFGLGNVGAIVAAIGADRVRRVLGVGRSILVSSALAGPAILLIAVAPREAPIPFLIASGFLGGFSMVIYNINQVSFRQAITPTPMQGRMNATMRFIVWGTIPVGSILGGAIATAVSIPVALWIGGIGSFLAVLPVLFSPVRSLVDMPTPADEASTGVEAAA